MLFNKSYMFCRISYYSTYHSTTLLAPVSDPTSQHGVCTVLLFRRHNPGGHWYLVCLVYVRKEIWSLPRSVLKTVYIPNFKVDWVAFLLRDQEVKGSTLGPAIGYGELEYIYDLTQCVEANPVIIRRIRPRWLPSSSFSIHHSIIIFQFDALNFKVFEPCTNEENAQCWAEAHLLHSLPRSYWASA